MVAFGDRFLNAVCPDGRSNRTVQCRLSGCSGFDGREDDVIGPIVVTLDTTGGVGPRHRVQAVGRDAIEPDETLKDEEGNRLLPRLVGCEVRCSDLLV